MFNFPPKQRALVLGEAIEFVSAGNGASTVVLVNGSGGPIEGWHKVFGPLAELAKVFAYNRPGIGGSEKPKLPQVGSHMVRSLRAALQAANCSPPYILVGHSLGGLIVNLFARLHPSEISAVVLIEATAPGDISVLAEHENGIQRFFRLITENLFPPSPLEESQQVHSTIAELKIAPLFPAVPLTVITGGKPAMAWATAPEALAAREANQKGLVSLSPFGKQIVAPLSGHFPQFTEPHLVVAAIKEAANNSFKPEPLRGSA
jgi:pimeloyl-ACP methyl ester carboxylesterase